MNVNRPWILSPKDSELASVLNQFVRQFLAHPGRQAGTNPWQRALNAERDRLVLVHGASAPNTIRTHLSAVFRRAHRFTSHEALNNAASNQEERHALMIVV